MLTAPDEHQLAKLLPGTWRVVATNFPQWLASEQLDPVFSFTVSGTTPLSLEHNVSYNHTDGTRKSVLGIDTWNNGGFVFHRRGFSLSRLIGTSWSVPGVSIAGTIAALRYSKSLVSPAGIDIVVRDGISFPEPRAAVASESERFGLSAEDFASLTWLSEQTSS